MANIAVIGTGYVGLTTSIGLASLKHQVICFDIDPQKIQKLSQGILPIYEPGLAAMLNEALATGNIVVTNEIKNAVENADFIFTCVPTPQDEDGSADLSYVIQAVNSIRNYLKPNAIVITKSTVPVGAAQIVENALNRIDVHVASNPEFLREGSAVYDFNNPDRIVVGARSEEIAKKVMNLYEKINCAKVLTSQPAAELIKYASNTFLAIKLSFVNDVAALCEAAEADPIEVMRGVGLDTRIGHRFLQPGPGWGGSCFPKDTRALASIANEFGVQIPLIAAAIASNETAHKRVVDRVMHALDGSLVGKLIAVFGVTFKANTDDIRDSPAIAVVERLIGRGARVKAYDPMVEELKILGLEVCKNPVEASSNADALLVLTEWEEFKDISPEVILRAMNQNFVVDTRNILNKQAWENAGAHFPKFKA